MDNYIIVLLSLIAIETSYLTFQTSKKGLVRKDKTMVFVDTSVLIDGRIVEVAKTGFLPGKLLIPRSVIGELQFLADNSDAEKRSRARHGLDIVSELQLILGSQLEIFQDETSTESGVDDRLLKLVKQYSGVLCTIDYNLNKVAKVEGLTVLNVNDLAMNLRMSYLPGERAMIELTQKGQDNHQAIGHLADGTMVVVERANNLLGKKVEVEFIRSLQTAAGKMMFAKLVTNNTPNQSRPTSSRNSSHKNVHYANKQRGSKRFSRPSRGDDKEQSFISLVNKQD